MMYMLTEEEFQNLNNRPDSKEMEAIKDTIEALRYKILKDNNFVCPNKVSLAEQDALGLDDGYCDECPLSFCKNEDLGPKLEYLLCDEDDTYYSK